MKKRYLPFFGNGLYRFRRATMEAPLGVTSFRRCFFELFPLFFELVFQAGVDNNAQRSDFVVALRLCHRLIKLSAC